MYTSHIKPYNPINCGMYHVRSGMHPQVRIGTRAMGIIPSCQILQHLDIYFLICFRGTRWHKDGYVNIPDPSKGKYKCLRDM